jgi:uncharacterized membrane protein SpoIIM required for sporulation
LQFSLCNIPFTFTPAPSVIIDLPRFLAAESPSWTELERMLNTMSGDPGYRPSVEHAQRFYFLYQKVSADLARLNTFASEPQLRRYLESLVARAYGEIHETRGLAARWQVFRWFFVIFPATFRRHFGAFVVSCLIMLAGCVFGGFAVAFDDESKEALIPEMFANHLGDPAERVRREEEAKKDRLGAHHVEFAGTLMANNIRVSILAMALGMTCAAGTIIVLFYNGLLLGVIAVDYVAAGQTVFLLGWLMPHGVIEIPAVLIAGQAGLVIGRAILGRGARASLPERLRAIAPDAMTLIGGVALMLVWAGIIESFLSQHHQPVIPYSLKITFGAVELIALVALLSSGKGSAE